MSKLYDEVVKTHGDEITEQWLQAFCEGLERKEFYDASSWGWLLLLSKEFTFDFRKDIASRAIAAMDSKLFGCCVCGEKLATKIVHGVKICDDCFKKP